MKTTLELPEELVATLETTAAREHRDVSQVAREALARGLAERGEPRTEPRKRVQLPIIRGGPGKILLTNQIINESEIEEEVQRAFGGHYRLTHAPVTVSEGNEIPALTNAEIAGLLDEEEHDSR